MKVPKTIILTLRWVRGNWKVLMGIAAGILIGFLIGVFFKDVNIAPTSALEFYSASAQISATIFSIFTGFVLLIIERESKDINKIIPKDFLLIGIGFFALTTILGLVGIATTDLSRTVSLGDMVVELVLIIGGFMLIIASVWDYYKLKNRC